MSKKCIHFLNVRKQIAVKVQGACIFIKLSKKFTSETSIFWDRKICSLFIMHASRPYNNVTNILPNDRKIVTFTALIQPVPYDNTQHLSTVPISYTCLEPEMSSKVYILLHSAIEKLSAHIKWLLLTSVYKLDIKLLQNRVIGFLKLWWVLGILQCRASSWNT